MKIVMFGAEFTVTGAGLMLCRWAEHLAAAGHDVSILPKDRTSGPLYERFRAAGVSIVDQDTTYIDGGTLVICNTIDMAPIIIQSAAITRTIWWIHEAEWGAHFLSENPQFVQAFAAADAVIFPTAYLPNSIYRGFLSGLPNQKFFIVPCGIDLPSREYAVEAGPIGPIKILSIGSIYPRKRHADLIKAVSTLDDLDLECVLAGRLYTLDDESMQLVHNRPDRFRLVGELPNEQALGLIDEADIFSLPSESEAMPVVNLEAAVRGKPLLLSDLGCHEGLWRHGHNCLMHPIGDVSLLAHMLRILATDSGLRGRLGAAAHRTALPHTIGHMLSKLDQVIGAICLNRKLPRRQEKISTNWSWRLNG
jgi:glycosyltransferase involved in cell wall biosynthesis